VGFRRRLEVAIVTGRSGQLQSLGVTAGDDDGQSAGVLGRLVSGTPRFIVRIPIVGDEVLKKAGKTEVLVCSESGAEPYERGLKARSTDLWGSADLWGLRRSMGLLRL